MPRACQRILDLGHFKACWFWLTPILLQGLFPPLPAGQVELSRTVCSVSHPCKDLQLLSRRAFALPNRCNASRSLARILHWMRPALLLTVANRLGSAPRQGPQNERGVSITPPTVVAAKTGRASTSNLLTGSTQRLSSSTLRAPSRTTSRRFAAVIRNRGPMGVNEHGPCPPIKNRVSSLAESRKCPALDTHRLQGERGGHALCDGAAMKPPKRLSRDTTVVSEHSGERTETPPSAEVRRHRVAYGARRETTVRNQPIDFQSPRSVRDIGACVTREDAFG